MPARAAGRSWTPTIVFLVIVAATVLSASMGLRQSLGLFVDPMVRTTGVSVAAFGFAMAVQNLAWGIGQPFMGGIADRFGGRTVVVASALVYAVGLFLMTIEGLAGLVIGGGLLIGLATAGTSHGVLVGEASRAASSAIRPTVVSLIAAAGSIGTFIIAPTGQYLIDGFGWTTCLMIFALIALGMGVVGLFLKLDDSAAIDVPSRANADARAAVREALAHPGYVAMTIAFFACGFQLIFVATHLPKYIATCGLPPSIGAQSLALIGICNAIGTLVIGKLGTIYGNKQMLALVYAGRTAAIGAYISLPVSVESTLLFSAAMGFLWLSVIPLVSGLIGKMFGLVNFGVLFGVMFFSHQIGAFLGAWLGGLSYDLSGNYFVAWVSLIAVGSLATLIQLWMDDYPRSPLPAHA